MADTDTTTDAPAADAAASAPAPAKTVADTPAPVQNAPAPGGLRESVVTGEPDLQQAPTVQVVSGTVPAKGIGAGIPVDTTVPVHEVVVNSDTVITDPNHELAVQPLEHDPSNTLTPIGQAAVIGKRPEEVFAEAD